MQTAVNVKKLTHILVTILMAVIALGVYQLSLVFSKSLYFNKNSWSYLTILADDLKKVPVFDPVEDSVSYRYGIGDGVTETTHSLMYKTTLTKMKLEERYRRYFESNGQIRVHEPLWASAIFYDASNGRYQVDVEGSDNSVKSVTIDFMYKAQARQGHPLNDP